MSYAGAHAALPRAITDALVSWAMAKECIEELWVRRLDGNVAIPRSLDVSLVVLLNGWNVEERVVRDRIRTTWREVASRWRRELRGLAVRRIEIEMLHIGNDADLNEMSHSGYRLFVAV
ncbi:hypothetical protein [Sphingomonas crocodyli]|uniref:Uncharacterized protein n=1 Tax=Sphingomonas crocodyli TaxID=1979270 RepID=A0A437LXS8_9SPHN|nr:hypothetical protein [Sphingomonas crocodyli]RVT90219.1 hypothetical protein EOD43_18145 [Sphingomonas crocodyli]